MNTLKTLALASGVALGTLGTLVGTASALPVEGAGFASPAPASDTAAPLVEHVQFYGGYGYGYPYGYGYGYGYPFRYGYGGFYGRGYGYGRGFGYGRGGYGRGGYRGGYRR